MSIKPFNRHPHSISDHVFRLETIHKEKVLHRTLLARQQPCLSPISRSSPNMPTVSYQPRLASPVVWGISSLLMVPLALPMTVQFSFSLVLRARIQIRRERLLLGGNGVSAQQNPLCSCDLRMTAALFAPPASNPRKTLFQDSQQQASLLLRFSSAVSRSSGKDGANHRHRRLLVSCQKPLLGLTSGLHRVDILRAAQESLSNTLTETNLHLTIPQIKSKARGKVRDVYDCGDYLVIVTTDRQSAFDRVLASVPFKGQVLNETSLWWFGRAQHITSNAVVSAPDKNVTIARKCSVFPVEFVVRGFVTGSTETSLWTVYNKGVRQYCGNILPESMVKNQKLSANILTPTTKAADHDVPVSPDEIINQGLMTQAEYDEASSKALNLFQYGQRVALEHGLLLVDTKYEFGKSADGTILLIDELVSHIVPFYSLFILLVL
ncbi:hypothetical protein ACLOJK_026222 [Asimina triloba]